MSNVQTQSIDPTCGPRNAWQCVVEAVERWSRAHDGLPLRDVVVLVPFAQLIVPAREAFARRPGWQPRVETTQTLQRSLGPPPRPPAGSLLGVTALDELQMARMLRRDAGLGGWEGSDPQGFRQAVTEAVEAAQQLHAGAACRPPRERDRYWDDARRRLGPAAGLGQLDRALAALALEWARAAPPPRSDVLFEWRCAGWIVLRAGGVDDLAEAIARAAEVPTLVIDTDPPPASPWQTAATMTSAPSLLVADGLEAEARATAQAVLAELQGGYEPVALIALDRVLVRRVRALLERSGVAVADETGWTLSTTRAAARVMSMLRAASPAATADDRLQWIKEAVADAASAEATRRLEAIWRGMRSAAELGDAPTADWLARATALLAPLTPDGGARQRSLAAWLGALRAVLERSPAGEWLRRDAAGQQVLAALGLGPDGDGDPARDAALQGEVTDLAGFTAWVDRICESAGFVPSPPPAARVVLTPLARAILRPFGAVVVGAADETRLGLAEPSRGLIGRADAAALGLPTVEDRLRRERAAFVQLLRLSRVALVRRRLEGDEPVGESPLVAALSLARQEAGMAALVAVEARPVWRAVTAAPVPRPAPASAGALPARLSATAVERLRACPYRFFARSVLGLSEADELVREVDKRDYGTWLHELLHRFHRVRGPAGDDVRALRRAADEATAAMALDPAAMLPFRASFERLLPQYLEWQHARDAAGTAWQGGEVDLEREAHELAGTRLVGRIDRIDRAADGALELIDYKTGSSEKFRSGMRNRFEDTQLAFYALLAQADRDPRQPVRASYLPLDSQGAIKGIEHPDVAESARALLAGLAHDLERIRAGTPMPALGEGRACDSCEARGLCRRDHWSDACAAQQ